LGHPACRPTVSKHEWIVETCRAPTKYTYGITHVINELFGVNLFASVYCHSNNSM